MTNAPYRSPMSDDDIQGLRQRNLERLEAARAQLGRRYLLHPENRVARLTMGRRVLQGN
jgi:hypothetical protein